VKQRNSTSRGGGRHKAKRRRKIPLVALVLSLSLSLSLVFTKIKNVRKIKAIQPSDDAAVFRRRRSGLQVLYFFFLHLMVKWQVFC